MKHLHGHWMLSIIGLLLCGEAMSAERMIHTFGTGSDGDPAWQRRYNAQLGHFRLDADGWLIDYRPERRSQDVTTTSSFMKPGGFRSEFIVLGDFNVSVEYVIEQIGVPQTGHGAGIMLRISFDNQQHSALLGHIRDAQGNWMVQGKFQSESGEQRPFAFKTNSRLNQLTIARVGHRFSFLKHEGSDRREEVFGYDPETEIEGPGRIELFVTSGGAMVPIRVRVHSIVAEADQLRPVSREQNASQRPWIYLALFFGTVASAAWLWRLRSR